jgi:predicted helicase
VVGERVRFYAITGNDFDKLTPPDFATILALLVGGKVKRARKTPLPHQGEALDHILATLRDQDRATALMACGAGKTLTALWVAERLAARRIVLVPSLALLRQTLHEWTRRIQPAQRQAAPQ